jgi:hypothetical protein
MSKQMIARLFFGSLAAFVGSMLVAAAAVIVAVNRDVFIMNGPDVVGVRSGTGAWAALSLGVLTVILLLASAVGGFVSWVGALAATGSRTDKTWFIVLLVLGLLSIGFLATLIYLVAGPPDELERAAPSVVAPSRNQPTPLAH